MGKNTDISDAVERPGENVKEEKREKGYKYPVGRRTHHNNREKRKERSMSRKHL